MLALQAIWRLAIDDALRQSLDNGGFAHPRLADQNRVVFRASLQHLDRAAYFIVPPDNGVQLPLPGLFGQVDCEFVQGAPIVLALRVVDALAAADLLQRRRDPALVRAALAQQLPQPRFVIGRGQGEQFTGDVLILAVLRVFVAKVKQPVQVLGNVDFPAVSLQLGQLVDERRHALAQALVVRAGKIQEVGDGAALLVQQRRHKVRRFDERVVAPQGQALRLCQGLLKLACQFVCAHGRISSVSL